MPSPLLERASVPVGAAMLGGATLGVSTAGAAFIISWCALGVFVATLRKFTLRRPSIWCLLFLVYSALSGIFFGGFDSLKHTSFVNWIANEGRVFLYYWPALFVLETRLPSDQGISRVIRLLILFVFANTLVNAGVGVSTFGTHHAAGAFAAMLVIYQTMRSLKTRHWFDCAFLLMAVFALLGSNSRTALVAAAVSIILVSLSLRRIRSLILFGALVPVLLVLMSALFPYQFTRLSDAANTDTVAAMRGNFAIAYSADAPLEVQKAWELSREIPLNGNANMAIRGYLFGRSFGEFVRSPILGIGFGRINDLGRRFAGTPHVFYPVVDAQVASATDQTAHNGYLQVLTELGVLGALPLLFAYAILWRRLYAARNSAPEWSKIGRASLMCIALMALTQHAFGAPIYGLSLFLLAAISYCKARVSRS